ncbi:MAG: TetR/AcrR family transcriptional regulator [Ilumatobacter sp.]|nr:TetR/AcrR family transcriptional regulator [Ilumatobacter sp.]
MTDITTADLAAENAADQAGIDPRVARSRAKVLEAATALLVELGPRGVTVDAVSERSGVAKSTLYRHWPSRTDLLVDVFRCNMPHIDPVDGSNGFEAALRSHVADVAATFADPEWSRMVPALFMLKNQFPEVDEITQVDRDQKNSVLLEIMELGVAEGRMPAGLDPTNVAAALFGPMMFALLTGTGDPTELGNDAIDRFLGSYADR